MSVRLYSGVSLFGLLFAGLAAFAVAQEGDVTQTNQTKSLQNLPSGAVIERIEFTGLSRIPLDAVKSRIASPRSASIRSLSHRP
jgi:hypothetical protein